MKKYTLLLALFLGCYAYSQSDIDQILEIGIENAQRFSEDYFAPAGELTSLLVMGLLVNLQLLH